MNKKKPNYIKLVRMLISNDRKILFISALSLIIGFTFLFTFISLSNTIIKTNQENTIKNYGKFLMVISNISKEDEEEITSQYSQFAFEHFGLIGDVGYKDKKITMGTMEENMGENLGFRLIRGAWPKNSHQIAVEEYLLNLFGIEDKKLPAHISLQMDGKSVEYEITGVISNYSYLLSASTDAFAYENAYPSIICREEKAEKVKTSLVILQNKLNFKRAEEDILTLSDIQLYNVCFNNKLYGNGYDENEDTIHLSTAYLVILNVLLLMEQFVMIRAFLLRNKKTLSLLEALGLSPKEKRYTIFYLVLGFTGFSLIIGYILAGLIGFTYINQIFRKYNGFYMQALNHITLAETLIAGVVLSCLYFFYGSNRKESIIKEMIGDAFNKQAARKKQRKYRFKRLNGGIIIIQATCIFFTMFSFYVINNFQVGPPGDIEVSLLCKNDLVQYPLKGYRIAEYRDNSFSFDALDSFQEYRDYVRLSTTAEAKQSTILLKKDNIDSYFSQYCEEEEDDGPEERRRKDEALWEQVSEQAGQYQPISTLNMEIVVLPQKEFRLFLKENEIQKPSLEKNTEKTCVLRLPNYKQAPSNPSVKENEMIELGRLQGNDEKNITFYSESFKVGALLSCDEEECSVIQVVMSEETARKSKTVSGYFSINIVIDKDTPASIQKAVEQKALVLTASKQGGSFSSSRQGDQRNDLYRNLGSVMCNTMLIFCIIATGIYIIFSIYVDWEKHSYEYGVLRSFGMSYSNLQNKLFFKYSSSIVIACVISVILGNYTNLYDDLYGWQKLVSIGVTMGATCLCRIGVYYWKKKEAISSMLNKG